MKKNVADIDIPVYEIIFFFSDFMRTLFHGFHTCYCFLPMPLELLVTQMMVNAFLISDTKYGIVQMIFNEIYLRRSNTKWEDEKNSLQYYGECR